MGPSIRTNLLKSLGSARRVRTASVADLAAVPKVTPKLAQRIYDFFHQAEVPTETPPPVPAPPGTPTLASEGDLC